MPETNFTPNLGEVFEIPPTVAGSGGGSSDPEVFYFVGSGPPTEVPVGGAGVAYSDSNAVWYYSNGAWHLSNE